MASRSLHGFFAFGLLLVSHGCQHRGGGQGPKESNLKVGTSASDMSLDKSPYDFCKADGTLPDVTQVRPWSASMVQTALTRLIDQPFIKGTVWSAYPVAYRRMTAARDKERCFGRLRDSDQRLNVINHHLADIMTRWLALETAQCATKSVPAMPQKGLCGVMKRAKNQNLDALSEAMATTAVYISSHLAMALTAVIADDTFWEAFPDPDTQRKNKGLEAVLDARIAWVKKYKPLYDGFNGFLAENLKVFGDGLKEAQLVKGDTLNLAMYFAKVVPCKAALFGSIRDRAFDVALSYARDPLLAQHPMLKQKNGGFVLNYGQFLEANSTPRSLSELETFAEAAVANPISLRIFRDLLGGVKMDTLEAAEPMACSL